jgi:hypothetical protein
MTLKVESKIQSHPSVASEIGAAHGMRMRNRARPLPRNGFISARARMLPSTITASCETNVNTNVFRRARWKTALPSTFRKFCRPTNENCRLPADELVRLRNTASRNGRPTSSAM